MENLFVYYWFIDDESDDEDEKKLAVRIYGINEQKQNICLHVKKFLPYFFVEVVIKGVKDWLQYKNYVIDVLNRRCKTTNQKSILRKQKLYFFNHQEKYPFLRMRFTTMEAKKQTFYKINKFKTKILGKDVQFFVHENEATPLLQLVCERNIPTSGWFSYKPVKEVDVRMTHCDKEFIVEAGDLLPINDNQERGLSVVQPCVLSFDIEVYSCNPKRMPMASNEKDCIFQISCIVQKDKKVQKYLINYGNIDKISNVITIEVDNEKNLLQEFHKLIMNVNPHVIIGYNIFGFDIPYFIARAKRYNIYHTFDIFGMHKTNHAKEKEIRWSSSACPNQQFFILDAEGRIFVDLLPIIKRDYKFSNYKLKTVSTFFLGETKDPLTHLDIFKAFEEGQRADGKKTMARCGKYCVQDADLVLKLFNNLQLWIGLVEMAKICNVPILYLFTQGQQIKVYSQVYKKGMEDGILIQSHDSLVDYAPILSNQGYSGAYVFPPSPGVYEWVVPFDFSSLYPTTIIAYNIDYSTLVLDESIPDKECHVIEWEDHIGCAHDKTVHATKPAKILCGSHRFRFIKEPEGVIPRLLKHLLDMRNKTKKLIKIIDKDDVLSTSLDKRQLAYKVSANSMYGAMGVQKGYLPFIPGAMCTTAMGRLSIQKAAEFVKSKHKGQLIYGDSVTHDTPLLIREDTKNLRVLTIEEVFMLSQEQEYPDFKPWIATEKTQSLPNDIEVMSANGWSRIRRVIRHKTSKKIYRVFTNKGFVDVTEDHSLLDEFKNPIKPEYAFEKNLLYCKTIIGNLNIDINAVLKNIEFNENQFMCKEDEKTKLFEWIISTISTHDYHFQSDDKKIYFTPIQKQPRATVLKIIEIPEYNNYVYDIETEDGTFMAGVGTLIVKNTDSIYCHFNTAKDASSVWKLAKHIESEFLTLFPPPMKLVFEEKIYKVFLILTKKRYMAYTCSQDGIIDEKLTIRGVLLARRDNCKWIREVYENIVRLIMENSSWSYVESSLLDSIYLLFQRNVPLQKFIVTKAVGSDYKIKELSTDKIKAAKRLEDLNISIPAQLNVDDANKRLNSKTPCSGWMQEYINRSKPAHIQLAEKMGRRGHPVEVGSRIEYVVCEHYDIKAKLFDKIEDPMYCKNHGDLVHIDCLYYLNSLAKPMDQLFATVFGHKDYVLSLYKQRVQFKKLMDELFNHVNPKIRFIGFDEKVNKRRAVAKSIYEYL